MSITESDYPRLTGDNITERQIDTLRDDAGVGGDWDLVDTCDRALTYTGLRRNLRGDNAQVVGDAREVCAEIIQEYRDSIAYPTSTIDPPF